MATTGAPLLTVMDVSAIVARINMAQDQAKDVKVGNQATMTPADGSEPVTGKVTVVSPATDQNSTTVGLVQADNPGERLRAVSRCTSRSWPRPSMERRSCRPPRSSPTRGMTIVKVVDDKNIAHDRPVQVGAKEPEMVQVSGVEPGDASSRRTARASRTKQRSAS
jgi:hypothetical protein